MAALLKMIQQTDLGGQALGIPPNSQSIRHTVSSSHQTL